jgi:acetyl-CoA carboxylase carboxyl transferase subunit alpha
LTVVLEFEKHIIELEQKIAELKRIVHANGNLKVDFDEIINLENKVRQMLEKLYSNLTPWQTVQVARHIDRPQNSFYFKNIFTDFVELCGDRLSKEDSSIIGGFCRFDGSPVCVIGTEKGHDTESRIHHNFGMPKPSGYRKSQRIMNLANKFGLPIITFVNTPGAYPGAEAEKYGQSEAIAKSIETAFKVEVPIIVFITGEGMSGGAIAIGVGDKIFMLKHSIYSVITPEGCSSILWKTKDKASEVSSALKLTAQDLLDNKIIDDIVPEPLGGAHRNPILMSENISKYIRMALQKYSNYNYVNLSAERRQKFLNIC